MQCCGCMASSYKRTLLDSDCRPLASNGCSNGDTQQHNHPFCTHASMQTPADTDRHRPVVRQQLCLFGSLIRSCGHSTDRLQRQHLHRRCSLIDFVEKAVSSSSKVHYFSDSDCVRLQKMLGWICATLLGVASILGSYQDLPHVTLTSYQAPAFVPNKRRHRSRFRYTMNGLFAIA
ncbi:unnamed protein product [Protopolystoma xenopodis]|uniref:Uncharacterized protein n=1 Tax=Protopolystoma xenopodis TaxID=117903 RepID=A0A3S5BN01_9PLAT|nr:unnamed protein product [Protopolystoma xenopodis]